MLVAFLDRQALPPLLPQQQEGGTHLLKHILKHFVFKGQGLGVWFCVLVFLNGLTEAAWEKPPLLTGSAGGTYYTYHLLSFKIVPKYQTC